MSDLCSCCIYIYTHIYTCIDTCTHLHLLYLLICTCTFLYIDQVDDSHMTYSHQKHCFCSAVSERSWCRSEACDQIALMLQLQVQTVLALLWLGCISYMCENHREIDCADIASISSQALVAFASSHDTRQNKCAGICSSWGPCWFRSKALKISFPPAFQTEPGWRIQHVDTSLNSLHYVSLDYASDFSTGSSLMVQT